MKAGVDPSLLHLRQEVVRPAKLPCAHGVLRGSRDRKIEREREREIKETPEAGGGKRRERPEAIRRERGYSSRYELTVSVPFLSKILP